MKWEKIGEVSVDSGAIVMGCPVSFGCSGCPLRQEDMFDLTSKFVKRQNNIADNGHYNDYSVVMTGDGTYNVEVRYNKRGVVAEIRIPIQWAIDEDKTGEA